MADNWLSREGHTEQDKSLPVAVVSHFSGDLDAEARNAVEGYGHDGHAFDPEAVLCTRCAETMEAA